MKTFLIADITRASPATEGQTLARVAQFASDMTIDPGGVIVVARHDQAAARSQFTVACDWKFGDIKEASALVLYALQDLTEDASSGYLLSYSGEVLKLAAQQIGGVQTTSVHLAALRQAQNSLRPTLSPLSIDGVEPQWTFEHVATLNRALDTLMEVLRRQAAVSSESAIRQTVLRPWMGLIDSAFSGNAVSTRSGGMLSVLLRIAATRGLICLAGPTPNDFFVWPKDPAASPVVESAVQSESRKDAPSLRVVAADRETTAASANTMQHRSRQMSAKIQEKRMGPFAEARPFVFEAIGRMLKTGDSFSVATLVTRAVEQAQASIKETGKNGNQPWSSIRVFTEKLLRRAGVLLDPDGLAITEDWATGGRVVSSPADEWRLRSEAEILFTLIVSVEGGLSSDDLLNAARAIYHSSSAQSYEQVNAMVRYLFTSRRVRPNEDGKLVRETPVQDGHGKHKVVALPTNDASRPGSEGAVHDMGSRASNQ